MGVFPIEFFYCKLKEILPDKHALMSYRVFYILSYFTSAARKYGLLLLDNNLFGMINTSNVNKRNNSVTGEKKKTLF